MQLVVVNFLGNLEAKCADPKYRGFKNTHATFRYGQQYNNILNFTLIVSKIPFVKVMVRPTVTQ